MTPDNDEDEDQKPQKPQTHPPDLTDIKGQNSVQYSVDIPT
jgi:hypothetical protein